MLFSCTSYYTPRNEFLTRPSVIQSVSPVFLVSANPLKPLNRISWNFVDIKDIMCRCAYLQEILIQFFFRSYALFELRNLAKMIDITQHSLLTQLHRISWNFVVMKDIKVDVHIHRKFWFHFFLGVTPFLNLEIWPKWKILLNTVCKRNSSETAQQSFVKLCSNEGHNV